MRLSFRLAAVKDMRKKKKKKVGGRRSIVKADLKSAATCREIPEDILIEILVRLPACSLMRFKCISKPWFSLISSKYFTDLFFKFSSMRGRHVFMYAEDRHVYIKKYSSVFSSSLSNLDSTASFLQLNHDLNLQLNHDLNIPGTGNLLYFVNALRGLVCFRVTRGYRAILRIINLTTRQALNVPCVKYNTSSESEDRFEWNYFGYDPVNDEYKLLRTITTVNLVRSRKPRSETQVLVLGAESSWRNTKSLTSPQPHHRPYGQGIYINGVLYYGAAWIHWDVSVLMSFDFNSEEFNIIEFPIEFTHKWNLDNLMNYQDQVAVFGCSRLKTESILDLWVLKNAGESKWSHKTLVFPYHQLKLSLELDESHELGIKGTSRSGEVMLSGIHVNRNQKCTHHALYDLEKNCITRGVVLEHPFTKTSLWEDVENIMYLEA